MMLSWLCIALLLSSLDLGLQGSAQDVVAHFEYFFDADLANSGSLGSTYDIVVPPPDSSTPAESPTFVPSFSGSAVLLAQAMYIPGSKLVLGNSSPAAGVTIGAWVKWTREQTTNPKVSWLNNRGCCDGVEAYSTVCISTRFGDGSTAFSRCGGGLEYPDFAAWGGAWHHVMFVEDLTASTFTVYFDGQPTTSNYLLSPSKLGERVFFSPQVNDILIGVFAQMAPQAYWVLDELKVYNRVFSAEERCTIVMGGSFDFGSGTCSRADVEAVNNACEATGCIPGQGVCYDGTMCECFDDFLNNCRTSLPSTSTSISLSASSSPSPSTSRAASSSPSSSSSTTALASSSTSPSDSTTSSASVSPSATGFADNASPSSTNSWNETVSSSPAIPCSYHRSCSKCMANADETIEDVLLLKCMWCGEKDKCVSSGDVISFNSSGSNAVSNYNEICGTLEESIFIAGASLKANDFCFQSLSSAASRFVLTSNPASLLFAIFLGSVAAAIW